MINLANIDFLWTIDDWWIVATGALAAAACGLVGSFLVLKRMSMMGDAISHAVLPGLALAFLIFESRASIVMFLGAACIGGLTAVLTQAIHRLGRVEESASMGVVFTTLFAIGLILMSGAQRAVDLDPGCVLYGQLELTPLDTVRFIGVDVPRAAVLLGGVLLLDVVFVIVFFKRLQITTFDPALATSLGINAHVMHYTVMALVATNAVAAFEAVGSILVVAMLIVPAATALLLAHRLAMVLVVAMVVGVLSAGLGHLSAITVPPLFGASDTNTAGMMAVSAGGLLAVTVLFAPSCGVISQMLGRVRLRGRIVREDTLGLLYRLEEQQQHAHTTRVVTILASAAGWRPLRIRAALSSLRREGLLMQRGREHLHLTDDGRRAATGLVRSHRLWESYLAKHMQVPVDHLHDTAMELEHFTDPSLREHLAAEVDNPTRDPHGRSVPEG